MAALSAEVDGESGSLIKPGIQRVLQDNIEHAALLTKMVFMLM